MTDGADQEAVERYLRNLRECEREKVVVDSAAASADEAAQYGLDAPRLKVRLQTEDGTEQVVAFGSDSPTDRFTYVQLQGDNPEIFVVRAWRFDNLDKRAFDLRDRRVLAFAKDEVMQVQRWGAGGAALLARAEPGWQLREPVAARADADAVDGLLDKIDQAEIEAFVAEDPDADALATYGLGSAPQVEIALLVGEDRAEKRLAIGGVDEQGRWYACDASRPQVFLVDSTLVQELTKGLADLRDKKPLRFAREQVERIVLTRGAAPRVCGRQGHERCVAFVRTCGARRQIVEAQQPPERLGATRSQGVCRRATCRGRARLQHPAPRRRASSADRSLQPSRWDLVPATRRRRRGVRREWRRFRRVELGYRRRGASSQKAGCTRRQQRRPQRRRR